MIVDYKKAAVALEQYQEELGDKQTEFLLGLWKLQDELSPEVEWSPGNEETLLRRARKRKPWLAYDTPQMKAEWFIDALEKLRAHIRDFAKDKDAEVFTCDLSGIKASDIKDAVYKTDDAVRRVSKRVGLSQRSDTNGVFALAVVSVIRCFARVCAHYIHCPSILDYEFPDTPVCPCCGSAASLAVVRPTVSVDGGHRNLYCAHCGTTWHYPRIRCSYCGSTDPEDLRYFYRPSEPAHQMHVCRDCETAMPTVMLKDLEGSFDPLAEEAVTLPLAYAVMNSQLVQDFMDRKTDWGSGAAKGVAQEG